MSRMYAILAIIGWAWTILAGGVLLFAHLYQREGPKGFDVVERHDA